MRYRKKPVEVEAMQWDGTAAGAGPIIDWILSGAAVASFYDRGEYFGDTPGAPLTSPRLRIQSPRYSEPARAGDWIVRDAWQEFHVFGDDTFHANYEAVTDNG